MEGVDSNGRMYLLKRPDHAEIEARLWRLYIGAEEKMEDYRNRLRFKVEDARRKEQDLVEWEDALSYREYKLDNAEDTVITLMRELKLKEVLILEKTAEASKYKRQAEDAVREARANERRFEEVCVLYVLCVNVLSRTSERFMDVRKVVMTMDTRFVSVCVECILIVLLLGRIPARNQVFV